MKLEEIIDDDNPKNKTILFYPDGQVRVVIGYIRDQNLTPEQVLQALDLKIFQRKDGTKPERLQMVSNVILSGSLKPIANSRVMKGGWHRFEDASVPENDWITLSSSCVQELLIFIANGYMQIKNGCFEGSWTYKTVGGSLSLIPIRQNKYNLDKTLNNDTEDLSDFVARM